MKKTNDQALSLVEVVKLLEKASYRYSFGPHDRELCGDGFTYEFVARDIVLRIRTESNEWYNSYSVTAYREKNDGRTITLGHFHERNCGVEVPSKLYTQLAKIYSETSHRCTCLDNKLRSKSFSD